MSVNKALSFALAVFQEVLVLSVYWDVSVMPGLERCFVTFNLQQLAVNPQLAMIVFLILSGNSGNWVEVVNCIIVV
ncbi:MAG: hypothetical protein QXQ65_06785 [Conexivisphaerales archaeon]